MRTAIALLFLSTLSLQAATELFDLSWPDRRPIYYDVAAGQPAVGNPTSTTNPRGWFQSATKVYVGSPAAYATFRTDLLARADAELHVLTNNYAQGWIMWCVEGCEFRELSYIGDPRKLPDLAPEMDAVADEYFAKFTSAGLRVGVCVRPQTFTVGTSFPESPVEGQAFVKIDEPIDSREYFYTGGSWVLDDPLTYNDNEDQLAVADFEADLLSKIEYAMTRWGCTLFYIDSYGPVTDYKTTALKNIKIAHPNILLIPECSSATWTNYFAVTAPLLTVHVTGYYVPDTIKTTYPLSFGCVRVGGAYSDVTSINQSTRLGNIMAVSLNGAFTNTVVPIVTAAWESQSTVLISGALLRGAKIQ